VIKTLQEGNFDKSVKVMAAYNIFEGGFFFDPNVKTDGDFDEWLKRSLPGWMGSRGGSWQRKCIL
jgi:hypothetical protein